MRSSLRRLPWHPLVGIVALLASIALLPLAAAAVEDDPPSAAASTCPEPTDKDAIRPGASYRPMEVRPIFDERDEAAALEAVQLALSEVGDGSTYVWYRHGGRLSGQVQPTQSFKDVLGRVCRHVVVTLNDTSRQRTADGIACRLADGIWQLDG